MSGEEKHYIHGYTRAEQDRLVEQAEYWRETLILPDLPYAQGGRLLEIGCGVGAVLGILGRRFPSLSLAGLDAAAEQIAYAREHMEKLQLEVELRQGDAASLPWPDHSFDHVYMMWFLEHLQEPEKVLAEAKRVLKPGGSLICQETDYSLQHAWPIDADIDYLFEGQRRLFVRNGTATIGRRLGPLLVQQGFKEVRAYPMGFQCFNRPNDDALRRHVDYFLSFLEPMVPLLVEELNMDEARLQRGLRAFAELPEQEGASFTAIVFRGFGRG